MKLLLQLAFILACCFVESSAQKNYILLVAGSNTYFNYRHQADVCHAYQIFHKNGIPDEQIVVMMYDDIANNKINPYKGKIFNKPDGPDVYHGVPKDYTGKDVNTKVFLAVLQGDKELVKNLTGKDGKVIESGPNDNVFVYYADHGAPGIVAMPTGPLLHAKQLNKALANMHKENKFAKMTFYMEACESGSMFYKILPTDINVYAVTAANRSQSSFGCYCDDQTIKTCLGDTFSIAWMEDTDSSNVFNETLETQFHRVYKRTTKGNEQGDASIPQQFGDLTFTGRTLSKFMAKSDGSDTHTYKEKRRSQQPLDVIPSELVGIVMLQRQLARLPEGSPLIPELKEQLKEMELMEKLTYDLFFNIVEIVLGVSPEREYYAKIFYDNQDIDDFDCYDTAVDLLMESCPKVDTNINTFFLRHLRVLVNLCNHQPTDKVLSAVRSASQGSRLCH